MVRAQQDRKRLCLHSLDPRPARRKARTFRKVRIFRTFRTLSDIFGKIFQNCVIRPPLVCLTRRRSYTLKTEAGVSIAVTVELTGSERSTVAL